MRTALTKHLKWCDRVSSKVVIPCYNAASTISEQLDAFAEQTWSEPWEIIVADNGSTDTTINIVEKYQKILPNLRVVDASKKRGPSHARNVGANAARGEALAFCDADDVVEPGWVAAMGTALSRYDFVGGWDKYWKLNEAWLVKSYQKENGDGVGFDHPYFPFKGAGNLGVKRSIHQSVGGFDENMEFHEDCDYCWRIQLTGVELKEEANAIVQIRLRQDISSVIRREYRSGFHAVLLSQRHLHHGLPQMVYATTWIKEPIKFCLDLLLLKIRDRTTLNAWLKQFAHLSGLFRGCIYYGYLPGFSHPGKLKNELEYRIQDAE
ncbi:glycosyltransferase [Brunnivagina elsteri]|uniref:Glycosyl transferase family 2 n=1 Tax=Brunnivagina elsteri CCALA 953 TaxID=987040 RepID=A0A2A2TCC7_9CYAN|nr:glycosyltransferase family A protein [Calothrix elsteri]PAX51069.1 glycosyl transferase family 2 [Calothrix elsteri CCALA 953]